MAWKIEYMDGARRQLHKLNPQTARQILDYMDHRVAPLADPRLLGKALTGNLKGLWRYRVGDFRILCSVEDKRITVVVVEVGHRRDIYD